MPPKKLGSPTLTNEKQEAAWWSKRRADVESTLRQSMRQRKALSIAKVLRDALRKEAARK